MAIEYANINPDNIRWARERAQLSVAMLANKLNISEEKLEAWERGESKITFKQARKIANKTLIPFGYLFLHQIKKDELPIPDLRTIENQALNHPSVELREIIKIILEQQDWYKEYLKQQGIGRNTFIGRFHRHSSVDEIVSDMRAVLKIPNYPSRGTWEDYFRLLVQRIEEVGVLVMQRGNLGHPTKPLSVDEFRGFAIFDSYAPMIFINQADVPSARLFTLIHELAHIWIGQSGISDVSPKTERKEEILCNAVAAEFLVPTEEFSKLWQANENWESNIASLSTHFRVSEWVTARRALTLNFIDDSEYIYYIQKIKELYQAREKTGSGPTYYRTRKSQLSEKFARALTAEALSGRILLRDAGHLLWAMKPHNIRKFSKELGI